MMVNGYVLKFIVISFWSIYLYTYSPIYLLFFFKFKVLCKTLYSQFSCNYYSVLISNNISSLLEFWRGWPRWDGLFRMSYIGISRLMYSSLFPAGLLSCITPKGIVHVVLWNCALGQHSLRRSLRLYKKCRWSNYLFSS